MRYTVIVYSNAFSFQFCASILSIMGYSMLWKCKDLRLFFLCYLPSIVRQNIFWNLPPHKTNCKLREKTTPVQLFITQRNGEKKKKSLDCTKGKGRSFNPFRGSWCLWTWAWPPNQRGHQALPFSLYILGAWELGHNLQKPERASRPTLLSVYSWCLGTWAQPPKLEGPQDLPLSHTEHNGEKVLTNQ